MTNETSIVEGRYWETLSVIMIEVKRLLFLIHISSDS